MSSSLIAGHPDFDIDAWLWKRVMDERDQHERDAREDVEQLEREARDFFAALPATEQAEWNEAHERLIQRPATPRRPHDSLLPREFAAPQPLPYLVGTVDDPLIPAGLPTGLVASGGTGKTQLLLQLVIHLALGRDFQGYRIGGPHYSVIVSGEEPKATLVRKLQQMAELLEVEDRWDEIRYYVRIVDLSTGDHPPMVESGKFGSFRVGHHGVEHVLGLIKSGCECPDLVVFDTLSTLLDFEETKGPVSAFVRAMKAISAGLASTPTTLVVGHVSKESAGRGSTDGMAGRGSSAFHDDLRAVLVMAKVVGKSHGNVKDLEKLLGRKIPDWQREQLRVLHVAKVPEARAGRVHALQMRFGANTFCFEEARLPEADNSAEQLTMESEARALRDEVATMTGPTARKLEIGGKRTRAEVARLIQNAEARGYITQKQKGRSSAKLLIPLYPDGPPPVAEARCTEELPLDSDKVN